jgi:hypothetical protein
MFELTKADVLGLQVMTDEVTGLARKGARRRHGGGKSNVCLITLSNSLNDLSVLSDILSIFG